jgi:hypothetical protein
LNKIKLPNQNPIPGCSAALYTHVLLLYLLILNCSRTEEGESPICLPISTYEALEFISSVIIFKSIVSTIKKVLKSKIQFYNGKKVFYRWNKF